MQPLSWSWTHTQSACMCDVNHTHHCTLITCDVSSKAKASAQKGVVLSMAMPRAYISLCKGYMQGGTVISVLAHLPTNQPTPAPSPTPAVTYKSNLRFA